MKALIYTDPHLDAKRTANTIPASRARLKTALVGHVEDIVCNSVFAMEADRRICVGDFFDTYKVEAAGILSALKTYMNTEYILAGNHDLLAHTDSVSGLVLLDQMAKRLPLDKDEPRPVVIYGELGKAHVHAVEISGAVLLFVPHVYTQELFEKSLDMVEERAGRLARGPHKPKIYVFLHCNIDSGFAEGSDIALNLTTDRAKALIEAGVNRIICGHEHEPRDLLQGRLIVLGNTHPTSFADMGSKRVMMLDTDTDEVEFVQVYNAERKYFHADWNSFDPNHPHPFGSEALELQPEWIRLSGTALANQVVDLAKLVKRLWETCPNLYGIKVDVKIAEMNLDPSAGQVNVSDLKAIISKELHGMPDLLALWNEVTQ